MDTKALKRFLLDRGMAYLYAVFIAGYFLLPMAAGHRRAYYILVFPAALVLWRELLEGVRDNALAALLLLYTAYMLCTLSWTTDFTPAGAIWAVWYALALVSFCLVSGYLLTPQSPQLERFTGYYVWLAAATALLSIVAWYLGNPFPESRLEPLGVMHHPNKAACVYGMFLVLGIHLQVRGQSGREKWTTLIACTVLLALVLFTQSRTALTAVCVATLCLMGYRAVGVLTAAVAISWSLLLANTALWEARVEYLSFRPGIWQQVISAMEGHWWFGHGYLADTAVVAYGRSFNHAHNAYLASLRDGGVIGLALLLAVLGVAVLWGWRLYRQRDSRIYLALLLYGMTCLVLDFDRLLVHPNETWLFFWLPLALVMAAYPGRTR